MKLKSLVAVAAAVAMIGFANINQAEAGLFGGCGGGGGCCGPSVVWGACAPTSCDPCGGCLLYTSPSPRDATLSRMPSSA